MLLGITCVNEKIDLALTHYYNEIANNKKALKQWKKDRKVYYKDLSFWKKLFIEEDSLYTYFEIWENFERPIEIAEAKIKEINKLIDRIAIVIDCKEEKIEVSDKLMNILAI